MMAEDESPRPQFGFCRALRARRCCARGRRQRGSVPMRRKPKHPSPTAIELNPSTERRLEASIGEPSRQLSLWPDSQRNECSATFQHLPTVTEHSKVRKAAPAKRTGKSMSRRTGQSGHIEKSGKWWVVRWWMDAGSRGAVHKRARICPVSGPGLYPNPQRKRRAREIIAESGADTSRVLQQSCETGRPLSTFQKQAASWLEQMETRKRKPVAPSTIDDWERMLEELAQSKHRELAAFRSQQRGIEGRSLPRCRKQDCPQRPSTTTPEWSRW